MNELSQYPVVHEQVVAWGDMDAFGHVNNVLYYRYIESARIRYLDELNIFAEKIYTVVASSQCKYLSPVFYPDTLKIGVRVDEIRNSAFRMSYLLWSCTQEKVVATAEAVMVVVDAEQLKKKTIPAHIKQKIIELEQRAGHSIGI
ncbi:acyl-CoA thioesterase [Acinetobacter ihumii]|uniref:acyl-CoA thioesterase n=1 Tax=Acinetobacter ihumii TaxID=2483802 RepID=UPI00102FB098|nr:thioesterase family protein [Acinetobacter ihumii]